MGPGWAATGARMKRGLTRDGSPALQLRLGRVAVAASAASAAAATPHRDIRAALRCSDTEAAAIRYRGGEPAEMQPRRFQKWRYTDIRGRGAMSKRPPPSDSRGVLSGLLVLGE